MDILKDGKRIKTVQRTVPTTKKSIKKIYLGRLAEVTFKSLPYTEISNSTRSNN